MNKGRLAPHGPCSAGARAGIARYRRLLALMFSKCSKPVNLGDFWAGARQVWPPGPRQGLHVLGWWG